MTERDNNPKMKGHNNIKAKGVEAGDVPSGQAGQVSQLWGKVVLFHYRSSRIRRSRAQSRSRNNFLWSTSGAFVVFFVVLHSGEMDDATGVIGLHINCIHMGDGSH
jgi:hypothetical protein